MELPGPWVAAEANDDIRRNGIGLDPIGPEWSEIDVPGQWQHHPKFAASNGPVLYRTNFHAPAPAEGRRRWVTFDGVFYQGDVWLDGAYLGDPEGYFIPHSFDITDLSRFDDEHVLAIEVTCAPQGDIRNRRNITGVLQQSEWFDRSFNPGGLWRPVRLYDTGPVRIDRLRVLCRDADPRRAHLRIAARLDSDAQRPIGIRTLIDGVPHAETTQVVASGDNDLEWSLDLADPALWWPRSIGDQPLTMVTVEVLVDGELSDRRQRRTGLRQVTWDDWVCSVNGERIFLKGANLLPTSSDLAGVEPAAIRDDIESAIDLGLDALRVHGHVAHRHTYDAADELGILLLQDFPLQWRYARSVRSQAVDQARALVDSLGHHPSIVKWSAHDDPTLTSVRPDRDATAPGGVRTALRRRGRPAASVVEQVDPRPVGEAIVRALRPDAGHGRAFRRRPPPAPTRRHRQSSLVRMAPRRGERPRRVRQAPAADGAVRQRVRRRFGADHRARSSTTNSRSTRGPTSTGSGSPTRTATTSPRSSGCSHPTSSPRSRSGSERRSATKRTCSRCRSNCCAR